VKLESGARLFLNFLGVLGQVTRQQFELFKQAHHNWAEKLRSALEGRLHIECDRAGNAHRLRPGTVVQSTRTRPVWRPGRVQGHRATSRTVSPTVEGSGSSLQSWRSYGRQKGHSRDQPAFTGDRCQPDQDRKLIRGRFPRLSQLAPNMQPVVCLGQVGDGYDRRQRAIDWNTVGQGTWPWWICAEVGTAG
jgi:hypothetical protein